MNEHNATEQAYKNGYKKGRADALKEFAETVNAVIDVCLSTLDNLVQEMRDEE